MCFLGLAALVHRLSVMSTTEDLKIAVHYAARGQQSARSIQTLPGTTPTPSTYDRALLFRLCDCVEDFMHMGCIWVQAYAFFHERAFVTMHLSPFQHEREFVNFFIRHC